jgi:very-short-patch-repair endonuclease
MALKIPQPPSVGEETLALHIRAEKLPTPQREYRIDERRGWRVDFAYPDDRLAIEVEGGIWKAGRHVRPKGYRADAEKYNAINLRGWTLLRFTTDMVEDGTAIAMLRRFFAFKLNKSTCGARCLQPDACRNETLCFANRWAGG